MQENANEERVAEMKEGKRRDADGEWKEGGTREEREFQILLILDDRLR